MDPEPAEFSVPKDPLEFLLLDIFCDEKLPLIPINHTGNTHGLSGFQLFNSSEVCPSLLAMVRRHGFEFPRSCWGGLAPYFKHRFKREALNQSVRWNLPVEKKKFRKVDRDIEMEREVLRTKWPIIPSGKQLDEDPGCQKRILAMLQLKAGGGQTVDQGDSAANPIDLDPSTPKLAKAPSLSPPGPSLPQSSKSPVTVSRSPIVPPQVPPIPLPAGISQPVTQRTQALPAHLVPSRPPSSLKRKRGAGDSRVATPDLNEASLEPTMKRMREAMDLEGNHGLQAHLSRAQAPVGYVHMTSTANDHSHIPQPAPSYPPAANLVSDPSLGFFDFDWNFPFGGFDAGFSGDGSSQSTSQTFPVQAPSVGSSQPCPQIQGDPYDSRQLAQQFNHQYPIQGAHRNVGSSSLEGQDGVINLGNQTYPQPLISAQVGDSETLTRPTSIALGSSASEQVGWVDVRAAFVKSAMTLAEIMFDNHPWCRVNPPWARVYELSRSEGSWNVWLGSQPDHFNSEA